MGCVSSKQSVLVTPALDVSGGFRDNAGKGSGRKRRNVVEKSTKKKKNDNVSELGLRYEDGESDKGSSINGGDSLTFRLENLQKYVEGEHVAAGWPAWLSAVSGEAIHGWIPLRPDAFEKLEKIGQGTYSSVFRARNIETGKIVALKKVRFDNFEPESVRFMAREITILRKLDHPNVIKLEGLITSRLSCSIYLVFEYMEHDLSGLLGCPDIKFSESQVKCYTKQLLSGLEHCHSRGVMHRDIKGSNLLINNEGVLKIADFGLGNFCSSGRNQPLTSRVVTLWYRPPELLLGSTEYGASVDLWSVGCVVAEILLGKPILQGRTEVEQLHKIFKLCGAPPDEYWKRSKLPHATLFKPQQRYESCLRETFNDLPVAAVNLIENLLSVEPYKRGTAFSALASEYFTTKPYACEPSSLPKYPPNKEIDAKNREDARRKKVNGRSNGSEIARKISRKPSGTSKLAPAEDMPPQIRGTYRIVNTIVQSTTNEKDSASLVEEPKPSSDVMEEVSHVKHASQGDIPFSGPLQVSTSSGFTWAKRRINDASFIRSHNKSFENSAPTYSFDSKRHENDVVVNETRINSRGRDSNELAKRAMHRYWSQFERPDSFDASDGYHSQELSLAMYQKEEMAKKNNFSYQDHGNKIEFSGPLLSQSHKVDEYLERHERHIRQTVRKSWFQRGKRHGR